MRIRTITEYTFGQDEIKDSFRFDKGGTPSGRQFRVIQTEYVNADDAIKEMSK